MAKLTVTFRNFANTSGNHSVNAVSRNNSSEIQSNHSSTLCGQDVEFFNVKPGGRLRLKCDGTQ